MFGTSYSKWSSPIKKGPLLKTKWDQGMYSGVFDMEKGYTNNEQGLVKKGTTSNDNDFSKVVRIWTNIRPKN